MLSFDFNSWKKNHIKTLTDSYEHHFNKKLLNIESSSLADAIDQAPFVLLSHGTESDPILNYGNLKALELWEMNWEELTQMPSRLTAEPLEREARDLFMKEVTKKGHLSGYQGVRISKTGKRFRIHNAQIWNLIDENNHYLGQAACFHQWDFI